MSMSHPDITNYDALMTLGRAMYTELWENELKPNIQVRESLSPDDGEEAVLVLESTNKTHRLTPGAMATLAERELTVTAVGEDHWERPGYAEWDVEVPDEILAAYNTTIETYSMPGPPKQWDEETAARWEHSHVMNVHKHGGDTDWPTCPNGHGPLESPVNGDPFEPAGPYCTDCDYVKDKE